MIISYTPDGFILYASPQVERYGYSVSEVVGRNLREFIHPDDRQRVGTNFRHAVETGEEFLTECRLIGGDGIMFYVEEIGKVVRDGDKIVQLTSVVRDITDRKCAEHIINKRDQLIKNTLESLARPFYVVNADDYSIALANSATGFNISNERSTCHALAYGRPTPCEAPDLPCLLAIVKETKTPAQVEHVFTGPDGKRHISEIHGYPIFDTAGNLHQMIEYSLDITNRKQAEEELRASEEKYRTLYSTMNEGVALHELVYNQDHVAIDFRITDINPAFEQIVGRKQEDIVGRLATEVYGVTPPSMLDIFARVVETGTPTTVEEYVYSAKKVLRISVFSPGPDRFATILEDITEHKHFKDQLRILGRLPEENPNPILRVDDAGTLLFANDQCQRILQEWHVQIGDHIPQRWHDLVAQSLETNTQREQEFECGDSTYLMFIRPVTEAGYAHMYLMDLTEHRRTEKALRESELQLRQAQKMEAIGRVAGGIAHDFNNLISIIAGHAELLALRLTSDNPLSYNAREIRETAEQASRLTHQLLAFSRKQVLEPRLLDLNAVIAGMNKMLHRLIGDNIELVIIAGPGLGTVKADPGQIEQVLMNLVVNGRDAMPDGGQITIETTNADAAEDDTRESAAPPGPYVCLRVTDTGKGMDDHTRAHIFEPFFTTKESGKGTGLGLATVYGIVKQSGGYITVDSEPGRGSTFAVCLPRVNEHPETLDRAAENETAASPGNVVIMVVEDEKEVRDMVCNILRAQGHGVVSAQNGKDALDKYQHSGEKIRLLLTDVVMPKMSGIDLAEKLLEQRPDLKVIFISGYTKSSEIRKSPVGKNSLFLEKPFAADQLRQTIDAMLG